MSDLNLDFACKCFGFWVFFFKKKSTDWANITSQFEHFELFFHLLDTTFSPIYLQRHSSTMKHRICKWKRPRVQRVPRAHIPVPESSLGSLSAPVPAQKRQGHSSGKHHLPSQQPQEPSVQLSHLIKLLLAPWFSSNPA